MLTEQENGKLSQKCNNFATMDVIVFERRLGNEWRLYQGDIFPK
jgi:hypothetical protein